MPSSESEHANHHQYDKFIRSLPSAETNHASPTGQGIGDLPFDAGDLADRPPQAAFLLSPAGTGQRNGRRHAGIHLARAAFRDAALAVGGRSVLGGVSVAVFVGVDL